MPTTRSKLKHTPPVKFSGDKESQNAEIRQWIHEANIYFKVSDVAPERWLEEMETLLTGQALSWYEEKCEEVESEHKIMTWEWLIAQMIEHYGHSTGALAERAEWAALRMGTKNSDALLQEGSPHAL